MIKVGENTDDDQGKLDFSKVASIEGNDTTGYNIKIPKEILDNIESKLKEEGVKAEDFGLKNFDCFRDFILAEIKTQFPDLGNANLTSTNGDIVTNGCIKIKRATINNDNKSEVINLRYTTKENLDNMCNNNDMNALNYFTLDESGKLIVANYSYTKTVVTTSGDTSIVEEIPESKEETIVSELSPIDYKSAISKYTLPFTFMLDILATSGGEDLALGIASLADTTELEITIETTGQDNHSEENYKYTQKEEGTKKFDYSIYEKLNYENAAPVAKLLESKTAKVNASPNEKECTINIVTDNKYNLCNIELTKVDSWIAKAEKVYQPTDVEKNSSGPISAELDEIKQNVNKEDYDINTDADVQSFMEQRIEYWKKEIEKQTMPANCKSRDIVDSKNNMDVSDLYKITNCTQTSSSSSTKRKYNITTSEIVSNEDKVFDIFTNNKDSFYKMKDAQEFLYEELEEDSTTVNFADVMRYLINKFENPNYKGELNLNAFELVSFSTAGGRGASVFGCNLTRDEFIQAAKAYRQDSNYQTYMAAYAGDFYDICTSQQYNINPCFAYAHACLETSYGSSSECRNDRNYFGYAHANTSSSGAKYSTPSASIKDYCEWIIQHSTPGSSSYSMSEERGTLYAGYNDSFSGNPSENIYDLFSTYAYIGDTHVTNDSDYTTKWGAGGRTYTRIIYGGYNYSTGKWEDKAKYDVECGSVHPNANSKTTTKEQADYAEYSTNEKINIAKAIFGDSSISVSGGNLTKIADEIHKYMEDNKYMYSLVALNNTFEESKNGYKHACCATYISWVLTDAGYDGFKGKNSVTSIQNTFKEKNYKIQRIYPGEQLEPGDIVFVNKSQNGTNTEYDSGNNAHVQMYGENGIWYNAGSTNAIQSRPHAYSYNVWYMAYRLLE